MQRDPWTQSPPHDAGVLRFMTCGSVDDGKSTLIGRLLLDGKALLADTLATLEQTSRRRGHSAPDLSLLTDGLLAEREQGITIDVAYRYFASPRRSFIVADAPGHEQYTRNMVTAASTADAAVLLVDAAKGLLAQTRRHAAVAALLGVPNLVLAVNKMDQVGHDAAVFDSIVAEFRAWLAAHAALGTGASLPSVHAVPLSALEGDMVVERGQRLDWYRGPTLLELLEQLPVGQVALAHPLRLPVQWVCRPVDGSARGYAGRLEAGTLAVGDEVAIWPSGQCARVAGIQLGEQALEQAQAGQSVMVSLDAQRDVSRGDVIVPAGRQPAGSSELEATVCVLSTRPLVPGQALQLLHLTREVRARVEQVSDVLDVHTLAWRHRDAPLGLNDIARVRLRTQQPLPVAPYHELRAAGSFILVDAATRDTVAAGWIA